MALTVAMMAATAALRRDPQGFLPDQDTGQIVAFTEGQEGIGFDSLVAHQKQVMAIVQADPAVDGVHVVLRRARRHRREPGDRLHAA